MTRDDLVRADYINSRDAVERLIELREMSDENDPDLDPDELEWLEDFVSQGEGVADDWQYGETFIRDDVFEDYARDLAEDIGAIIKSDYSWPVSHIDWPAAADALKQDYSAIDVQGTTYWCP